MTKAVPWGAGLAGSIVIVLMSNGARAQSFEQGGDTAASGDDQSFAIHIQSTATEQYHPAFHSPYQGAESLDPRAEAKETADVTLYAGFKPWAGAEIWINPEVDQGFGLSNTMGVAGFPSGEAYKVGANNPYLKLPRLFLRQTIDLGGQSAKTDADLNVLGGAHTENRLVFTIGKFGVPDVFDTNASAHDPRQDFLNWSLIDTGTFDYAANAWGFTYGAALEWYQGDWTLRAGLFDLSRTPNSAVLDPTFDQYQEIGEVERRWEWKTLKGKVAITGFITHGRMGNFADAIALVSTTGQPADVASVRKYQTRSGLSLNAEQSLTETLGLFVRAGEAGGNVEPYEFSDIDRTAAAGLSQGGKRWGRDDDTVAIAFVVNGISKAHEAYLAAGGDGILVGDGQLPHPGDERILETYYSLAVIKGVHVTADYQYIANPAYNRDRGPVSVFGLRVHAQY
jgi:high affinity Mn2+ porin